MCTAVSFKKYNHYFGRNLDLEFSYNEEVIITPRNYIFEFRHTEKDGKHFAIIGIGITKDDFPLYFDATNEKGLSMVALNFPEYAKYADALPNKTNIASFELIPYVLSKCSNVSQAKEQLLDANITKTPFSNEHPPSPLHWMIADKECSVTVESTIDGLKIYDNPVGVLANSPTFDIQLFCLNNYMGISHTQIENNFSKEINFLKYSNGMGSIGLPGDLSSTSRFVRACFTKFNSVCKNSEDASISQFFHILESVKQQQGCAKLENGNFEKTVYTSCCNTDKGIYYYTTYENFQISAVNMYNENLDAEKILSFPLISTQTINYIN